MITYPRFRMVMMVSGIGFWIWMLYDAIGLAYVKLFEFAAWLAVTFGW